MGQDYQVEVISHNHKVFNRKPILGFCPLTVRKEEFFDLGGIEDHFAAISSGNHMVAGMRLQFPWPSHINRYAEMFRALALSSEPGTKPGQKAVHKNDGDGGEKIPPANLQGDSREGRRHK